MPQFVISGISTIIFAITGSGEGEVPSPGELPSNSTAPALSGREGPVVKGGGPESYAYIFR